MEHNITLTEIPLTPSWTNGLVATTETQTADNLLYEQERALTLCRLLIVSVGIVDNAFVILVVVFYTSMTKTFAGCVILNQTCIDFAACLFGFSGRLHKYVIFPVDVGRSPFGGALGELYCRLWVTGALEWCFILASTINLVVITIERYISVVWPIWHKQQCSATGARLVLAGVWIFGIAYTFAWSSVSSYMRSDDQRCLEFGLQGTLSVTYGAMDCVMYFLLPVACMMWCYPHMIFTIRRGDRVHSTPGAGKSATRMSATQRSLLKTTIMVSLCFVLCWVWHTVTWLLYLVHIQRKEGALVYPNLVALVNLIVNPFIYIFHYRKFRAGMRNMVNKLLTRSQKLLRQMKSLKE